MKLNKVIEKAAQSGIKDLILTHSVSSSLGVSFVQGKHEDTTFANDFSFDARGGLDGHLVSFHADTLDNKTIDLMIKTMLDQKSYTKEYDTDLIIARPDIPYAKNKQYYPRLKKLQVPDLKKIGQEFSDAVYQYDSRIVNVGVEVRVGSEENEFLNTKGLSLKSKSSYLLVEIQAVAEEKGQTVSDYIAKTWTDVSKIKKDKVVKELCKELLAKLHCKAGVSGTKVCLVKPHALKTIVSVVLSHLSMFNVDQKLSLLADKVGQKVFSEKLTIEETPNTNDVFSNSYDSEGYPTSNKILVENGVIKTYLYDQEMAKKYNHAPTGNGYGDSNIHPSVSKYSIHPGSVKEKDLIKSIEDGYIITSLTGANAGISHQTGGFTLSGEGFYVKNGKIKYAVNQFTVGGDVCSFLANIIELADKPEDLFGGRKIPSALVKDLVIAC